MITNLKKNVGYQAIEDAAQSAAAQQVVDAEFASAVEGLNDGVSRRRWLQLMGASMALGAAAGCRYQTSQIVPFSFRPQNRVPGVPVKYRTTIDFAGVARPLEVVSYDGRPIKIDGNPDHADSGGATDAYTQARILELYDPDRLRMPQKNSAGVFADSDWETFIGQLRGGLQGTDLSRVAVLAEPTSSPSLLRVKQEIESRGGHWFTYSPINDDSSRDGSTLAFAKKLRTHYHLDQAKIIVSLDADLLQLDPAALRNSRQFAQGRDADHGKMSRMYVVESQYTITGSSADHRISLPASKIGSFLNSLAAEINSRQPGEMVDSSLPYRKKVLASIAQDLVDNQGHAVIAVGENQPAEVQAIAHKLNAQLKNHGATITFTEFANADRPSALESIKNVAAWLQSDKIDTLVILGGNPVFNAPADVDFAAALAKAKSSFHLSFYRNETSLLCDWIYNSAHALEAWGDGRSHNGSWCIAQPLVAPLFDSRSDVEVLASAMGDADVAGSEYVKQTAALAGVVGESDDSWNIAVHDGFIKNSASAAVSPTLLDVQIPAADEAWLANWKSGSPLEMTFIPSLSLYDGRFANSGWLQELPDFITKITWDNAALVNPETAKALGLKQDFMYTFSVGGKELRLPVHIQPGQPAGSISVAVGYGRTAAGRVGGDQLQGIPSVGQNVYPVRTSSQWYWAGDCQVNASTKSAYPLSVIQENWEIDKTGRDEVQRRMFRDRADGTGSALIREGTFASYQEYLTAHPPATDDHATPSANDHSMNMPSQNGVLVSLPIINVAFSPETAAGRDDKSTTGNAVATSGAQADQGHDEHGHEDHGHGAAHAPQWPEGFHLHHENFDLTPGVRDEYTQDNVDLRNVWGMSIDLNKCTGCNACVVACQAENNIPVVGKSQVKVGREMHWIRLDRYFGDNLYNKEAAESDDKQIVHQPVTCHHCENAPCETVCPVAATVHSTEGLNDMVYNRCIGTRYCGNNCPYKVRRFNYFNYSDAVTFLKYPNADKLSAGDRALQNMMMNPEVTIRSRGVMEKCTYCVQRIQNTKIQAKVEGNRPIGANEVQTACQQACPTQAIIFGDLNHPESNVHAARKNYRKYYLLDDLNNRPRTFYLARVRNPHPSLVDWDDRGSSKSKNDANATVGVGKAT